MSIYPVVWTQPILGLKALCFCLAGVCTLYLSTFSQDRVYTLIPSVDLGSCDTDLHTLILLQVFSFGVIVLCMIIPLLDDE